MESPSLSLSSWALHLLLGRQRRGRTTKEEEAAKAGAADAETPKPDLGSFLRRFVERRRAANMDVACTACWEV